MQGLITLDFGNSHPHAGLFCKDGMTWKLLKVVPITELELYLSQFEMNATNSSVVLCEVKSREEEILKLQEKGYLITRIKDYWRGSKFAGMPIQYSNSLGEDRLIQAFYTYKNYKTPSLIIDAGTFTTIDVINEDGFQGGYIAPGLKNYLDVFKNGENLKNYHPQITNSLIMPQDTNLAIAQSYIGFYTLAQKLILDFSIKKVLLTGGNGQVWHDFFQESKQVVPVSFEPFLIHHSIMFWMSTQIEPI